MENVEWTFYDTVWGDSQADLGFPLLEDEENAIRVLSDYLVDLSLPDDKLHLAAELLRDVVWTIKDSTIKQVIDFDAKFFKVMLKNKYGIEADEA